MAGFSVAFQGMPKSAEAAARSMLQLLLPMLGNRWQMGDPATSDVVILETAALSELNRVEAARPMALYVVFEEAEAPPANAFTTVRRPLNSSRLIEVLHKAQAELERRSSGMGETTTITPIAFDPDSADERGIRTSMRTATRWVLQDKSRAVTVLSQKQTRIFSTLPDKGFTTRMRSSEIADLIRTNDQVVLLNLNDEEKAALVGKQRRFEHLSKLEWIYWLAGSNGELRPELHVSKPYRLRRWPDFSRLPHYRADVRMASLLKAEPLTVGELAERTGVRLETACNFVNACWSLGFLATPGGGRLMPAAAGNQPAETKEDEGIAEEPTGLFGSLRNALGLKGRKARGE